MKTFYKVLAISILATILFIIGSAILPFSDSFKEGSQNTNSTDIIFLLLVNIWFTLTVLYIGKSANRSKKRLITSLIFVYFTIYCFMTQIETIFFGNAFETLSKNDGWVIMIANIIPLIVIIPLTLKIAKGNYPISNPPINIKISTIFLRVGFLSVVYSVIYFLFGYFIAWQFTDLRVFYTGTTEKQSFIQKMIENFQYSNIVPFQLLRGLLFSLFILPIVFIFKNNSKQLLVSLVLVYLSTSIVLIIPNFLFPDPVRWAHFIEMMTSMSLFAMITWLIWRKKSAPKNMNNELIP
ncbi:MAG TPA: hypothetical protein VLZ83_06780 [Edaphocola sp.]|nr:hypothetical protein [Edaphocola sp.]